MLDGFDNLQGGGEGRVRRVDLRNNCTGSQTDSEKGEEREAGQVHLARADAVFAAQDFKLGIEDIVGIGDPFGRASAARCEKHGGCFARLRAMDLKGSLDSLKFADRATSQQTVPPKGDIDLHGGEGFAAEKAKKLCGGYADESFWRDLGDTVQEARPAHAWVDHNGNRPKFEKCKDKGIEIE